MAEAATFPQSFYCPITAAIMTGATSIAAQVSH